MKELIILCFLFSTGVALECYICENQPDNKDKCIKSTVQCREDQDTCETRIVWRAPQFWTPRSEKMHNIFKSCGTSTHCSNEQFDLGLRCMRDWYKDWECVECCQGDRCNYYVTLGSTSLKHSTIFLGISLFVAIIFSHFILSTNN